MKLTAHFHTLPMSGATPLLPLYVFMGMERGKFTFYQTVQSLITYFLHGIKQEVYLNIDTVLVDHVQSTEPTKYLYGGDKYLVYDVKLMFHNIRDYYIIK